MSPVFSRFVRLFLVTAACLPAACGGDGGDLQAPPSPAVAQVVVAAPETTLVVGQTAQVTATARDSAGNPVGDQTFTWASTDSGVAAVSETGMVTAAAAGTAAITATAAGVTGGLHDYGRAHRAAAGIGLRGPRTDRHRHGLSRST